jgi:hypothetical protein
LQFEEDAGRRRDDIGLFLKDGINCPKAYNSRADNATDVESIRQMILVLISFKYL